MPENQQNYAGFRNIAANSGLEDISLLPRDALPHYPSKAWVAKPKLPTACRRVIDLVVLAIRR